MSRFTELIKDGKVGKWCKRGASIIAVLGTLGVLIQLYGFWQEYRTLPPQNEFPSFYLYNLFLTGIFQLVVSITTTIFFYLILYTAGSIIHSFSAPVDSDIIFERLEDEEVASIEK